MSVDLKGYWALILEEDVSVWLELEAILSVAGCEHISSFHFIEIAELWLKHVTPDLAIIDTSLGYHSSQSIVEKLAELNVPVVIYSEERPASWDGSIASDQSIWLHQPSAPYTILAAIGSLIAQKSETTHYPTSAVEPDVQEITISQ